MAAYAFATLTAVLCVLNFAGRADAIASYALVVAGFNLGVSLCGVIQRLVWRSEGE